VKRLPKPNARDAAWGRIGALVENFFIVFGKEPKVLYELLRRLTRCY
jgi:hypothetical protein